EASGDVCSYVWESQRGPVGVSRVPNRRAKSSQVTRRISRVSQSVEWSDKPGVRIGEGRVVRAIRVNHRRRQCSQGNPGQITGEGSV
ncbi:unnamed protein product, partial [Staurois parvus]